MRIRRVVGIATIVLVLPVLLEAALLAVRVDTWDADAVGPLDLKARWHAYPSARATFKHPPAIVVDGDRRVLHLRTTGEAMRIGRAMTLDVKSRPWLVWEWKPLVLPAGGDVRNPRRNDQAGRVMLVFEGLKAILYVWDTTAPVGAETNPDTFEMFQRVLIVVRSGPDGVGAWHRERRDVRADYMRVFGGEPGTIKLVGFESHSNDTATSTSMLFGAMRFEPR